MTLLTIESGLKKPIYRQIVDQIREAVNGGRLKPGAALPSVRQLAGDLEINPNTVSKAYMLLEREGVLRTAARRGVFVADRGPDSARSALRWRLELLLDAMLEESRELGFPGREVLSALERRLHGRRSRGRSHSQGRKP